MDKAYQSIDTNEYRYVIKMVDMIVLQVRYFQTDNIFVRAIDLIYVAQSQALFRASAK